MRTTSLRVGRLYAVPTDPGPWHRSAAPARVIAHGPGNRTLVMLPDGLPAAPGRDEQPRSALVWLDDESIVARWEEWPEFAASTRAEMTAVVASAVAALGGDAAPTVHVSATVPRPRWWSRPIHELLRPPPVARDHALHG